jgi:acyl-homoserine-lactone acylase
VNPPGQAEADAGERDGGTTETAGNPLPPGDASIVWDEWGVPHITASTDPGLCYAFGWAQMRAHGDLILRLYGEARGRAAEYWGEDHLAADRFIHTMGVPRRAEAWLEAQSATARACLEGFVDGMNAYSRTHPMHISDEAARVLPLRPADVLAHVQRVIHLAFVGGSCEPAARAWSEVPGSNGWAIAPRSSTSGKALLLINPHLPWQGLFTWFEVQLQGPALDVYGAALVGMPFVGIGFTECLGWTHTVNTLKGADLFALDLLDGGYAWDEGVRPFEVETACLRVRQADGSQRTEELHIEHSVHGPVVARRQQQALALRLVGLDQPHVLEQYWAMARATCLTDFEAATARLQMPFFNTVYADRDGHIMYLFGGRVPVRPGGTWADWLGPIPGRTSATLWTATHTYADLPRVVDPPAGWVQNANDPPWFSTFPPTLERAAFPAYMAPEGLDFRPQRSLRLLLAQTRFSFADVVQAKHDTRAELADHVLDELVAAARQSPTPLARRAAEVLAGWDRHLEPESRGAVLFAAWMREAALPRGMGRSPASAYRLPWRAADPLRTPVGLADGQAAVVALVQAAEQVLAMHSRLDVAWGDEHRFQGASVDLAAHGGADPLGVFRAVGWGGADAHSRRGAVSGDSFVAVVEFSSPVRAQALLAYGNASQADRRPDDRQLELMAHKSLRSVWRRQAEIEAHTVEREVFKAGAAPR